MTLRPRSDQRTTVFAFLAAVLLLIVYFGQHVTAPPNGGDGALMLSYVDSVSRGERLHFDFFDYYGVLAYPPASAFYAAAGEKVIGVHVYMLLLKLLSAGAAYLFTRRLASTFYAVASAVLVAALVGQRLPQLQIPYAAYLCFPVVLLVWVILTVPQKSNRSAYIGLAGALTGLLLWTKVTEGAFLLAGGLFHLFYLYREPGTGQSARRAATANETRPAVPSLSLARRRATLALEMAGLVAYATLFHLFIREHYGFLYFLYLSVPLGLALAAAAHAMLTRSQERPPLGARAKHAVYYFFATFAVWLAIWLIYFGPVEGTAYLGEQARVLSRLKYAAPFPPIGREGDLGPFNRYFWPQLPWVATAAFAIWLVLRARAPRAAASAASDASCAGAFTLLALHTFIIYARSDEIHLLFATLPAVPVVCILAARLEQLVPSDPRRKMLRVLFAGMTALGVLSIVSVPRASHYALGESNWGSPRLEHLRYHDPNTFVHGIDVPVRQLDIDTDAAARHLDALTEPGEEVLVLGRNHLVYFASETRTVGGRYRHLFYLLREGALDPQGLTELVPASVLERLYRDPPRVMVGELDRRELADSLPELQKAIPRAGYKLVGKWGVFRLYQRDRLVRAP